MIFDMGYRKCDNPLICFHEYFTNFSSLFLHAFLNACSQFFYFKFTQFIKYIFLLYHQSFTSILHAFIPSHYSVSFQLVD